MQRQKPNWRGDRGARAIKTVCDIKASIAALNDEDLLDLHDIFRGSPDSVLGSLASDEAKDRELDV
jgi:hypothetical protein